MRTIQKDRKGTKVSRRAALVMPQESEWLRSDTGKILVAYKDEHKRALTEARNELVPGQPRELEDDNGGFDRSDVGYSDDFADSFWFEMTETV